MEGRYHPYIKVKLINYSLGPNKRGEGMEVGLENKEMGSINNSQSSFAKNRGG